MVPMILPIPPPRPSAFAVSFGEGARAAVSRLGLLFPGSRCHSLFARQKLQQREQRIAARSALRTPARRRKARWQPISGEDAVEPSRIPMIRSPPP